MHANSRAHPSPMASVTCVLVAGLSILCGAHIAGAEPSPTLEHIRPHEKAGQHAAPEEAKVPAPDAAPAPSTDDEDQVSTGAVGAVVPTQHLGFTEEGDAMTKLRLMNERLVNEAQSSGSDANVAEIDDEEDAPSTDHLLAWSISSAGSSASPIATGEVRSEIEYYDYYSATDPEDQRTNWLSNVHLAQNTNISDSITVESLMRVVLNSDGENRRFYSDFPYEGVYVPLIKAEYAHERFRLYGGKYEPAAGLHGYGAIFFGNYSRDLDLDGRIGGGVSVTGGSERLGQHSISADLFRIDRSRFRGELWSDRWRDDEQLADAGPLGAPKSFLISVNGTKEVAGVNLAYTIAGGNQHRGTLPQEEIVMAAILASFEIPDLGEIELSLDGMRLRGAGGYQENRRMVGGSIGWSRSDYYLGATYTGRRVYLREAMTVGVDQVGEIVGRYSITQRTTAEAAYQHVYENGRHENALGIVLNYVADWIVF